MPKDGYTLNKDEIITILDFFQNQYVHYDNILMINLLRNLEKEWKKIEKREQGEKDKSSEMNADA